MASLLLWCGLGILVIACASEAERSGLGDLGVEPAPGVEPQWATVGDQPAVETVTVRGTVVVQATDEVTSPILARIVESPLRPGDPVDVGDVIAVLQPTTPELEALDSAVKALAEATTAAAGPAATRPSSDQIQSLVAARDQAADTLRSAGGTELLPVVEVLASSPGMVVHVAQPLGAVVDLAEVLVTVGPTSSVEVHARVENAVLELFTDSADRAVVLEQTLGAEPQTVTLAPLDERVVSAGESATTLRMDFVDPPRLPEGTPVDVEVVVLESPGARSVPVAAVRSFDGSHFVLVDDDQAGGGLRRVDVTVVRLGTERAEIDGAIDRGDRVLLR